MLTAHLAAAAQGPGFLSPTGVEIAFVLVGLATLGAAVITVNTKQLVHAALWLVVALGGIAVEYLLLTAEFIAWVQVLIYLGSVVVLLLFGLMLTKAPHRPLPGRRLEQPLGRARRRLGRGRRARLGRRRRLPHHLDRPRRPRPGLHQGLRRDPLPALGAALRGALRPPPRGPDRRHRAVPQGRRAHRRRGRPGRPGRHRRPPDESKGQR
ncbi:hypothetical protein GCM10020254_37570 [Streptomyces goshikiensis]